MKLARLLLSACFLGACSLALGALCLGLALARLEARDLPDVSGLRGYRPAAASTVLAADGSPIGRFAEQDRTPVPLAEVPDLVVRAFLSAEDRNFWRHAGLDPAGLARAVLVNLRNRGTGRRPVGGSTISQQLVKNLLTGDEASLRRKAREALLAVRLERALGKRALLELYLNQIYLGQGAYGVAAAAEVYFGKPLARLGAAEAALLAAMPKAPANYDPVRRPEAARARRAHVLRRMAEDGAIPPEEAARAAADPLPVPAPRRGGGAAEGHFAEEVRRQAVAELGAAAVYRGGLVIRSSMDPALQEAAEAALRAGLIDYDRRRGWRGPLGKLRWEAAPGEAAPWRSALALAEAPPGAEGWRPAAVLAAGRDADLGFADGSVGRLPARGLRWARRARPGGALGPPPAAASEVLSRGDLVLVEPGAEGGWELRQIPRVQGALVAVEAATGRVLAMAGGFAREGGGFNRATQARRQPGSAFKPFVYLTALERGYDPASPVLDAPIAIDVGGGAPRWRPGADEGGWGLVSLRRALENSRNMASVRLLYDLGLEAVGETARRFGLHEGLPNYAAALGALETTPLRLAAAYAALANGGLRVRPTLIDAVEGPDGRVLARRDAAPGPRVADAVAVAQLTSVLRGVVLRGTAAAALGRLGQEMPLAGKTGTTNDNFDAWFAGYSPGIAAVVHVGFDRPESLGETEVGGRLAAPVFGAFMRAAAAARPGDKTGFEIPPGARVVRLDPATGEPSAKGVEEVLRAD